MTPLNPELRRQLWHEFSPIRIFVLPIILGLIYYVATYDEDDLSNLFEVNVPLIMIGLFLYGSYKASKSFIDEVSNSTWDTQKMSSLPAWKLALGKLFGGTSYVWYGFIICTPFFLIGFEEHFTQRCESTTRYFLNNESSVKLNPDVYATPQGMPRCNSSDIGLLSIYTLFCVVISATFAHATALLLSIHSLSYKSKNSVISPIINAIIACVIGGNAFQIAYRPVSTEFNRFQTELDTTTWWGQEWSAHPFMICSLLFFMGWALIGVWRSMRKELQYKDIPLMWIAFQATFTLFLLGFLDARNISINEAFIEVFLVKLEFDNPFLFGLSAQARLNLTCATFIALAGTYVWAGLEARHSVRYKQFFLRLKKGELRGAAEAIPKWFISLAIGLTCYMLILLSTPLDSMALWVCLLLLTIRDLCALHIFYIDPKGKRGALAFAVYIGLVYVLLPLIKPVTGLFIPVFDKSHLVLLFSLSGQTAIAAFLLIKRWKTMNKHLGAS